MTKINVEEMMKTQRSIEKKCKELAKSLVKENENLPDLIEAQMTSTRVIAGLFRNALNNELEKEYRNVLEKLGR